jgi:hypothetical protein
MKCSACQSQSKKREYLSAQRRGGGSYRRPARGYDTTVCRPCAEEAVRHFKAMFEDHRHPGELWMQITYRSLFRALGQTIPR